MKKSFFRWFFSILGWKFNVFEVSKTDKILINTFFRDLLHRTRWLNNAGPRQASPGCPKACPKWNFRRTACPKWCEAPHKWDTMECYPKIQLIKAIVITPPMRDFCHNCEEVEKHSGCNPTEEFSIVSPTVWRKEGFSSEKTRQLRLPSVQPINVYQKRKSVAKVSALDDGNRRKILKLIQWIILVNVWVNRINIK